MTSNFYTDMLAAMGEVFFLLIYLFVDGDFDSSRGLLACINLLPAKKLAKSENSGKHKFTIDFTVGKNSG